METTATHPAYEKLTTAFAGEVVSFEMAYDFPVITVKKEQIVAIIRFLYDEGYQFLTDLCGIHLPDNKGAELGVVYHLHDMPNNQRLRIKTYMSMGDGTLDSLTAIFPGANWMERETYDFFGIIFKGHPNLKRILNMDEMNYFPLRKEYPLEDGSRDDKRDSMFGR